MDIRELCEGTINKKGITNFVFLGIIKNGNDVTLYGYDLKCDIFRPIAKSLFCIKYLQSINVTNINDVPCYDSFSGVLNNKVLLAFNVKRGEKTFTYVCDGTRELQRISKSNLEKLKSERKVMLMHGINTAFLTLSNTYVGKKAYIKYIEMESMSAGVSLQLDVNKHGEIELQNAITNCRLMTIPRGVEVIKENAIRNMDCLISIVIPNTVRKIEDGAIRGCKNLCAVNVHNKDGSTKPYRWETAKVDYSKQMTVEETIKKHKCIKEMEYKGKLVNSKIRIYLIDGKEIHVVEPEAKGFTFSEDLYEYIQAAVQIDKTKPLIFRAEYNGVTFDMTKEMSVEDYDSVYKENLYAVKGYK